MVIGGVEMFFDVDYFLLVDKVVLVVEWLGVVGWVGVISGYVVVYDCGGVVCDVEVWLEVVLCVYLCYGFWIDVGLGGVFVGD